MISSFRTSTLTAYGILSLFFLASLHAQVVYEDMIIEYEGVDFTGAEILRNSNYIVISDSDISDNEKIHIFDHSTYELLYSISVDTEGSPAPGNEPRWPFNPYSTYIALSDHTLVIGLPKFNNNQGRVEVYELTTGERIHQFESPAINSTESFGKSVAIGNNLIAVGAPGHTGDVFGSGIVYIYDAITGDLIKEIISADAGPNDSFGSTIAIDNNTLAVGCLYDNFEILPNTGSVYTFNPMTGEQTGYYISNTPAAQSRFGSLFTLKDGYLAVVSFRGSPLDGVVEIFDTKTGDTISIIESIAGRDRSPHFGYGMSIFNDMIAIGDAKEFRSLSHPPDFGVLYIHDIHTGTLRSTLYPSVEITRTELGNTLNYYDDTVITTADGKLFVYTNPPITYECSVDYNYNYSLELDDVLIFANELEQRSSAADYNKDGRINYYDIADYLARFGLGCDHPYPPTPYDVTQYAPTPPDPHP